MKEKDAKMKRPAFQFYPGDWMNDPSLSVCSLAAQGLWIRMMCIAHQSEEYGYLTVAGNPLSELQLARLVGEIPKVVAGLLAELEEAGVFSRNENGAIYSRRMVKDERLRNIRAAGGKEGAEHGHKGAEHGKKGGRPSAQNPPMPEEVRGDNNPPSTSPINPPPSSSSSSSSSVEKEEAIASSKKGGKSFVAPTQEEVRAYFAEKGYRKDAADKAFAHYNDDGANWKDSQGKQVRDWKQKMRTVWFKDENRDFSGKSASGVVTAENAVFAVMQPPASQGGNPEKWPIAEYRRLQGRTEYKLLRYE